MLNVVDIAKYRYTTKHYDKNKHVSKAQLEQLLAVIQNSPSSVNAQPWHFVVVDNQLSKDKILPAILDFNHSRVEDSSYSIIFCIKASIDDNYLQHLLDVEAKDERFPDEDTKIAQDKGRRYFIGLNSQTAEQFQNWSKRQLYIALGQLLYAASAMKIDSTPIEGFDPAKMDELLNLPVKGFKSVVVATIGYRSSDDSNAHRPKSRLPKQELFSFV